MDKLYNIEFGTFVLRQDKITISIDDKLFLSSPESNITNHHDFLTIQDIAQIGTAYQFTYSVDFTEYKNLKNIRKENISIRLSISETILQQDILSSYDGYVSLHPGNMWYRPMNEVKYAFRSNLELLSYSDNVTKLTKYKALLLYILFGYPYDKALNQEYRINKDKNPVALQIISAESLEQLISLISYRKEQEIIENLKINDKEKNIIKIIMGAAVAFIFISNILTFVITKNGLQVSANEQLKIQLDQTSNELHSLKYQEDIQKAVIDNDYVKAAQLMEQAGNNENEIADFLCKNNEYNLALQYTPDILERVIQTLYKNGDQTEILHLEIVNVESNQVYIQKLAYEKSIVSFNTGKLDSEWMFCEDKYSLIRTAQAYINNANVYIAQEICTKLSSMEFQPEYEYGQALLESAKVKNELTAAQQGLEDAKTLSDEDVNKANLVIEAENNINQCNTRINELETIINTAKTELEKTWANEQDY